MFYIWPSFLVSMPPKAVNFIIVKKSLILISFHLCFNYFAVFNFNTNISFLFSFKVKRNIVSVELHVSHYIKMVEDLQGDNDRLKSENTQLKKELEDLKAQNEAGVSPAAMVEPQKPSPPPQSHLPPAVAAAVAAINSKIKQEVSTATVGVNTSPAKASSVSNVYL